jgi:hypothetical protein
MLLADHFKSTGRAYSAGNQVGPQIEGPIEVKKIKEKPAISDGILPSISAGVSYFHMK